MKKFSLLFILMFVMLMIAGFCYSQSIVMNEIYSRGTAGNLDWIEIYNPSTNAVTITGYKIYDIGGQSGSKTKKQFPDGTIVPAKGFYVIITDTADFTGDLSGFGLSSSGEKVWLEDNTGTIIDSVNFPAMSTTQSYGRNPDGETWQLLNTITRGFSNVVTSVNENIFSPENYFLAQNYPNPFNPSTTIVFTLTEKSKVNVSVFNLLGEKIDELVNAELPAGFHELKWNADSKASGIYLYKIQAGKFSSVKKMSLIR
jgi:hypothetical protein